MFRLLLTVVIAVFFIGMYAGCSSASKIKGEVAPAQTSISQLRFLSEFDVPHAKLFENTTVGGLSGIDYDSARNVYYLISDDRSALNPARFYTAKIHLSGNAIDSVEFIAVHSLLQQNGEVYPNSSQDPSRTPDPEAMRYNPLQDELVWSSEGERIVKPGTTVLENPSVTVINMDGRYKDSFALPAMMQMQHVEQGPRQNGVFEGMTFADNYKTLFVNVEEPLYQDGPRAATGDSTALIRIIKYNTLSHQPVAQYAYRTEAVAHPANPPGAFKINGVPDILSVGNDQLLVIERSFSTGRPACTIRVFMADLKQATDISGNTSLQANPPASLVSKKRLLNMDDLGRYIDNVEGVTFGPVLSNGHRTLIFVADDNFSPFEKTQFLLFEVIP
ncbi:MAG TPA: esterase-like activity of phytase family protein [Chitinophagaceae bacterium]|nr:esterase-like activity of phytase family protein [Chitinophagaceae bacterium]